MIRHIRDFPFSGLYAITDAGFRGERLAAQVERAIAGGARVIQYRDKGSEPDRRRQEASEVLSTCHAHGVPLLINDDVELARTIGADGVHIGREDAALERARAQLGESAIIGVSCYNRLELALAAHQGGADYVAFGRFFSSESKPAAVQADLDLLLTARQELDCPLVAIGGITAQNGRPLIEAGADMLAVIRGVFAAPDVTAAARSISSLFSDPEKPA